MFYNFTEDLFIEFRKSYNVRTDSYKFPKSTAEAFYMDIIREFPKLREPKPLEWSESRVLYKEIHDLVNILSGADRFYKCYFNGLEHNNFLFILASSHSFEDLELRIKNTLLSNEEEYRFFDYAMNFEKHKKELYKKYLELFKIAESFKKSEEISVTYTDGEVKKFFKKSSSNRLGYNFLTLTLVYTYFKNRDQETFKILEPEFSIKKFEVSEIVDDKGAIIIKF